jgi:hypothetical protein
MRINSVSKAVLAGLGVLGVGACAAPPPPVSPEPPVTLAPMPRPDYGVGSAWRYLENGQERVSVVVSRAPRHSTWISSTGCHWTQSIGGFAPPLRWTDACDGKGGRREVTAEGDLYPLQIGSAASFRAKGRRASGKPWREHRNCAVVDQQRIIVPAGGFDTFHVVCDGSNRVRHWHIAPEIGVPVLYWDQHKKNGQTRRLELLEWAPR